jgi:hypothetical protein
MSQKGLFLAAMVVVLPIAVLTTVGSGIASGSASQPVPASPVTFVGNVSCNLVGKLTINPPVTDTSNAPETVTFNGKNSKCVGLPTAVGTTPMTQNGVKLKSSHESFVFSFIGTGGAGALCQSLKVGMMPTPPTVITMPINWTGTGPITQTLLNFPNGLLFYPGLAVLVNGSATGSFAGTSDVLLGYNLANVFTACASSTGLSSLPINQLGGDNLMVGPAF